MMDHLVTEKKLCLSHTELIFVHRQCIHARLLLTLFLGRYHRFWRAISVMV